MNDFVIYQENSYLISKNEVKKLSTSLVCSGLVKIKTLASKIFRLGEETFLLSSYSASILIQINDLSPKAITNKDWITNDKTLIAYKSNNFIIQVTPQVINVIGNKQILLNEMISLACHVGNFLILAANTVVFIYKSLVLVKQFDFDEEVLSLSQKNQSLMVAVKTKGLFLVNLESLIYSKYEEFYPIIANFYFSYGKYEIFATEAKTFIKHEKIKSFNVSIFRVSLAKETLNSVELVLEGFDTYLLKLPSFELLRINCCDCILLYNQTYLAACGNSCEIGELKYVVIEEKYSVDKEILSFAPFLVENFIFNHEEIICLSQNFEEIAKQKIESIDEIFSSKAFDGHLMFSCSIKNQYYLTVLNTKTFEVVFSVDTESPIINIDLNDELIILRYDQKVELMNKSFKIIISLRFLNHEFEEYSKKLEKQDIDSIVELKINQNFQSIISFFIINTGRTEIEKFEHKNKEFVCITTENVY